MSAYYPPVGFHFRVEFDLPGISDKDFRFREVSGLSLELEEETHSEGGENRFTHKLPVRARYPDLVLKRGLVADSVVRTWCEDAIHELDIRPTTIWVALLNPEHEPLQTYTFVNAWPKKWSVSDLNAESSQIVVESLELAYQYYRIE
jgi:phage tail-like protein